MERLPVHIITVTEIKTVAMQSRGLINVIKKKKKTAFVGIKNTEDMQLYFHLGLQVKEIHVISFIKFVSKKSNLI